MKFSQTTPKSSQLLEYCSEVFTFKKKSHQIRYTFDFVQAVSLVIDDYGIIDEDENEIHIVEFEVDKKYRGFGYASIVLSAVCKGADYFGTRVSLTPQSYAFGPGLDQKGLEAFYRRYGFRYEKGSISSLTVLSKQPSPSMIRLPKGIKQ